MKTFGDEASFISLKGAISIVFYFENPFATNGLNPRKKSGENLGVVRG